MRDLHRRQIPVALERGHHGMSGPWRRPIDVIRNRCVRRYAAFGNPVAMSRALVNDHSCLVRRRMVRTSPIRSNTSVERTRATLHGPGGSKPTRCHSGIRMRLTGAARSPRIVTGRGFRVAARIDLRAIKANDDVTVATSQGCLTWSESLSWPDLFSGIADSASKGSQVGSSALKVDPSPHASRSEILGTMPEGTITCLLEPS